jgi:non-specific serine/threonine protein kinase
MEEHLHGTEQVAWLRRLNPERDNIRAVLAWSHAHDGGEVGLRLAGALHLFWRFGGYVGEGRRWLTELLALPGGAPRSTARALLADSILAIMQGDYQATRELAEQSAAIFAQLHEPAGAGRALTYLAVGLFGQARYAEARPFLEASIAACREADDTWGLSNALGQFSSIPLQQGDLPAALAVREEALANARQRGDRWQVGLSLMGVARIVGTQGDHRRAGRLYLEALTVLREVEDLWLGPRALSGLACVDVVDADYVRAARLFGAAEAMRELAGTHEMPAWRAHFDTGSGRFMIAQGTSSARRTTRSSRSGGRFM